MLTHAQIQLITAPVVNSYEARLDPSSVMRAVNFWQICIYGHLRMAGFIHPSILYGLAIVVRTGRVRRPFADGRPCPCEWTVHRRMDL